MTVHARYAVFQMAEVAVPRDLFRRILELNGDSYRLKHSASRKRATAGAEQNKASADSRPAD